MFLFGNKSLLQSLRAQWVLGALIATLPLLGAMAYALIVMDHHNRAQRHLVVVSAKVAEISASILDQAKDLERVSRQYQVLKDERIRQLFLQKTYDFRLQIESMQQAVPDTDIQHALSALTVLITRTEMALTEESATDDSAHHFKILQDETRQLTLDTRNWVQAQLDHLETEYRESQWHLMVMGSWALPGTFILVWLVSVLVLRPVYQLSTAVQRMGKGDLSAHVQISGSSEIASLGENLRWMQQQLLSLESQKQAFLQQITHELKTPLAAIMEAGSLLADEVPGRLNNSQQKVLVILRENANSLQTLIQQLLDYNSVVKDAAQQCQAEELQGFIRDKLQDLFGLANARNVNLILRGESLTMEIDIVRVSMILRNLVSNAVQLTASGASVYVEWGTKKENGCWWLKVIDHGPGIAEDEMNKLFLPFYQGRVKRQGSLKGSGIGLAIVKECCDFLGAVIDVENLQADNRSKKADAAKNQQKDSWGACFCVTFPPLGSTQRNIEAQELPVETSH
ncbi:MAG: HAMP domain-containing histidine kinase [Pseudomonadales bacterium]|nr:HAMP domain-containing histidine kinase [Pseudomonadales bacterium]